MTIPLFFLAGCSIAQSAIKVDYYQLDYQLPSVQNTQAMDVVLGVRRFGIAAAYDHDRLVQREKDLRITQSYYHRWVNNPRMMLSDLVLRDLSKSGNYKAVVLLPSDVAVDYEINGFVQEIVVDDSGKQPHVILSLDVTLLGTPARKDMSRVIFQKSYVSEVPCPNKSPAAIAEAMSSATKDISARLQQDIHGGIAGTIS